MTTPPHTVVFPLASNASALLSGAPVDSVRRRLKLCSLFFDTVYLERGAIQITAGPTGNMTIAVPPGKQGFRWQSPSGRKPNGEPVRIFMRLDGASPGPWDLAMETQATIDWRPTFEPFRNELPPEANKWLHFVDTNSHPLAQRMANAGLREDLQVEALRRRFPDPMVRGQVLQGLNKDLAASGLGRAAVSVDALHRQVLACRRAAGNAVPVLGPSTLQLLFPRVEHLPWADIAELRNHRDIEAFRKVLIDVELAAAESEVGRFDVAVHKAYADATVAAERRMNGSGLRKFGLHAFGFVTGVLLDVTLGIPGVPEAIGIGLGEAAERGLKRAFAPRWRAFDRQLRERIKP